MNIVSGSSSSAATSSNLFRGNSLASKSFDQFMKVCLFVNLSVYSVCCLLTSNSFLQIVALPYLHETISSVIDTVYNDKKTCELNIDNLKQASK